MIARLFSLAIPARDRASVGDKGRPALRSGNAVPGTAPAVVSAVKGGNGLLDLKKFDGFTPAEVAALPRPLRLQVVADRKRRVTAALRRVVAS